MNGPAVRSNSYLSNHDKRQAAQRPIKVRPNALKNKQYRERKVSDPGQIDTNTNTQQIDASEIHEVDMRSNFDDEAMAITSAQMENEIELNDD